MPRLVFLNQGEIIANALNHRLLNQPELIAIIFNKAENFLPYVITSAYAMQEQSIAAAPIAR